MFDLSSLLIALVAGVLGSIAMLLSMRTVFSPNGKPINMLAAVGSLFLGRTRKAELLGAGIHFIAGVIFSFGYIALFLTLGLTSLLKAGAAGIGFGFLHGLVVAYGLMAFIADRHPIEEYRCASLPVACIHLVGHLVFGGTVGIVAAAGFKLTAS